MDNAFNVRAIVNNVSIQTYNKVMFAYHVLIILVKSIIFANNATLTVKIANMMILIT